MLSKRQHVSSSPALRPYPYMSIDYTIERKEETKVASHVYYYIIMYYVYYYVYV